MIHSTPTGSDLHTRRGKICELIAKLEAIVEGRLLAKENKSDIGLHLADAHETARVLRNPIFEEDLTEAVDVRDGLNLLVIEQHVFFLLLMIHSTTNVSDLHSNQTQNSLSESFVDLRFARESERTFALCIRFPPQR